MNASIVDKATVNRVINDLHSECSGRSPTETFAAICILLQKGGTSKGMNANSSITIGDSKITKGNLHRICINYKITPRQLARTLADHIHKISAHFNIPGNQARNFKIEFPNSSIEDLTWASDFQTFNESYSSYIREWLIRNYQSRFNKNPQTINQNH